MKQIFIILFALLIIVPISFSKEITHPRVWGKIYKTKEKKYGHRYFVYFKRDGIDYVFPLSSDSKLSEKKLNSLIGKYAQIYGQEQFEEINLEESKHILTFKVSDAKELTLADLNQNTEVYSEQLYFYDFSKKQLKSDVPTKTGISDKAVNTAILIGGTLLAADVLSVLLQN